MADARTDLTLRWANIPSENISNKERLMCLFVNDYLIKTTMQCVWLPGIGSELHKLHANLARKCIVFMFRVKSMTQKRRMSRIIRI